MSNAYNDNTSQYFSFYSCLAVFSTVGTTAEAAKLNYKDLVTQKGEAFDVKGANKVDAARAKALLDGGYQAWRYASYPVEK